MSDAMCASDCGCAGGQPAARCRFQPGCPRCAASERPPVDPRQLRGEALYAEMAAKVIDSYTPDMQEAMARVFAERQRPPVDPLREAVAVVVHRWKHPTYRMGEQGCRCREDATMAVDVALSEGLVASPAAPACICGKPAPMAGTCFDIDGDFWPGHGSASPAAPRPEGLTDNECRDGGCKYAVVRHAHVTADVVTAFDLDSPAAPRPEGLDVERLARALEVTGHVGNAHILALGIDPGEHDDDGCLFRPESLKDAAAIAHEYVRLSDTGDTP